MKGTNSWTLWSTVIVVATTLGIPAAHANAQTQSPVGFGVFAGGSLPVGDFGDVGGTGWHAGALIDWRSPLFPVGIRGDLAYHQFGSKDTGFIAGGGVTFTPKLVVGTLNLVWSFPVSAESAVSPYIIGGGGFYNERGSCTNCNNAPIVSETKFGLNGGAGVMVSLSGFGSLIEARYHLIFDSDATTSNSSFITLSAGIIFR